MHRYVVSCNLYLATDPTKPRFTEVVMQALDPVVARLMALEHVRVAHRFVGIDRIEDATTIRVPDSQPGVILMKVSE